MGGVGGSGGKRRNAPRERARGEAMSQVRGSRTCPEGATPGGGLLATDLVVPSVQAEKVRRMRGVERWVVRLERKEGL